MNFRFTDNATFDILDAITEDIADIRHYMLFSFFINHMDNKNNNDNEWCKYIGAKEKENGEIILAFKFFNLNIFFLCVENKEKDELVIEKIEAQYREQPKRPEDQSAKENE